MWANAQRDGRPAEYRWRTLFNAAVWLTPTLECRAVTLPRSETRWNLQGCPKLTKRSQPPVGRSSPYCWDMLRRYGCLTSFFPIVDKCLNCEDIARQSCGWCPDVDFLAIFCILYFQRAAYSTFQTCILNSKGHTMCGSMVNIQSPTAEIRRGIRKEERNHGKNTMSASARQGGHNNNTNA